MSLCLCVFAWGGVAEARPPDAEIAAVPAGRVVAYRPEQGGVDHLAWVSVDGDLSVAGGSTGTVDQRAGYVSIDTIGDVDGDGAEELFVWNTDEHIEHVVGVGGPRTVLDLEPVCPLTASDIDGDGFDDLVSLHDVWHGGPEGLSAGGPLEQIASDDSDACGITWALGDIEPDGRDDVAISRATAPNVYGVPGASHGSMTLYLGHPSDVVPWPLHWTWDEDTTIPGTALVPAELDGDDEVELVALSTSAEDCALYGRLLLVDELGYATGPTILAEQDIDEHPWEWSSRTCPSPSLANLGDLDEDGDDEVLLLLDGFVDGAMVRILDVEPETVGLVKTLLPAFDLEVPSGALLDDGFPQAIVGDYDADGWRDVAVAMAWTFPASGGEQEPGGTIAIWHGATIREVNGFGAEPGPTGDGAGCGCSGTGGAGSAFVTLGVFGLVRRRR